MKEIISNIRIINSAFGVGKHFMICQLFATLFSVMTFLATSSYLPLLVILLFPCIFIYQYITIFNPALKNVKENIKRANEYKFMNDRFNKVN